MDIVSATAALSQLLGQTLSLVQQIQKAREHVKGISKRFDDGARELESVAETLALLKEFDELQTAAVINQITQINRICQDLRAFCDSQAALAASNSARQYVHAFSHRSRDEKTLEKLFNRLLQAKMELSLRIRLAHVGVSRDMHHGLVAMRPTIERIDRRIQSVCGGGLQIAESMEEGQGPVSGNQISLEKSAMLEDVDRSTKSQGAGATALYVANISFDQARQINGSVGGSQWLRYGRAEYRNNEARDNSLQINGDINGTIDGDSFAALLGP